MKMLLSRQWFGNIPPKPTIQTLGNIFYVFRMHPSRCCGMETARNMYVVPNSDDENSRTRLGQPVNSIQHNRAHAVVPGEQRRVQSAVMPPAVSRDKPTTFSATRTGGFTGISSIMRSHSQTKPLRSP